MNWQNIFRVVPFLKTSEIAAEIVKPILEKFWKNSGKYFFIFSTKVIAYFAPSESTILAFLLISTPIERKHSNRHSRAMRLAGIGGTWEEFGKIKGLAFELISGALGSWEIFFKLHTRACVRTVP